MKPRSRFAVAGRAAMAVGFGLAHGLRQTILITGAGVALNWSLIWLTARAMQGPRGPRIDAALEGLVAPLGPGLLLLLVGLGAPSLYLLVGQRHGGAAATRRIYHEYRDELLHGLVDAWRKASPEEGGRLVSQIRATSRLEALPAPVQWGVRRLLGMAAVRAGMERAAARARTAGDPATLLALLEQELVDAALRPSYGLLWLLVAANLAALVGVALLIDLI